MIHFPSQKRPSVMWPSYKTKVSHLNRVDVGRCLVQMMVSDMQYTRAGWCEEYSTFAVAVSMNNWGKLNDFICLNVQQRKKLKMYSNQLPGCEKGHSVYIDLTKDLFVFDVFNDEIMMWIWPTDEMRSGFIRGQRVQSELREFSHHCALVQHSKSTTKTQTGKKTKPSLDLRCAIIKQSSSETQSPCFIISQSLLSKHHSALGGSYTLSKNNYVLIPKAVIYDRAALWDRVCMRDQCAAKLIYCYWAWRA